MKKRIISIFIAVAFVLTFCVSLAACSKDDNKDPEKAGDAVDYGEYAFTEINWIRDAEECIETLSLKADGDFSYTCSCGNPVNDADLIEGYTYDDKTRTITFNAIETTDDMVTCVTVISCDGEKLVLDFDGEEREFVSEDNYVHTEEVDYNEFSFTNMDWKRAIEGCSEIINFGPFGSFSYYCFCRDHKDYSTIADKYTYDSETGIVTLNIIAEDTEGVSNTLKIVSYDSEKLVIELDGETLEFIPG